MKSVVGKSPNHSFGLQNYIINSNYANFSQKIMNYALLIMNYFVPLHPQNDILHILIAYIL